MPNHLIAANWSVGTAAAAVYPSVPNRNGWKLEIVDIVWWYDMVIINIVPTKNQ